MFVLYRRGQQWSIQTFGGSTEESKAAGKPSAEVQRGDAHTQGAQHAAGQWEWDSAGAAAGKAAGAGEDEGTSDKIWWWYDQGLTVI